MMKIATHGLALAAVFACAAAWAGDRPPQTDVPVPAVSAQGRVIGDLKLVPVKPTFPAASAEAKAAVKVEIEPGQTTADGKPGFGVAVAGWTPNGRITAMLMGPKGESVYVIPFEQPMQIGPSGGATFLVPYTLAGLAPGAWKLVIDGASGEHTIDVQIPVVHVPDAEHKAAWVDAAATPPAASNTGPISRKH